MIRKKLQRMRLRRAYLDYVGYVQSWNCGEHLVRYISTTANELWNKLETEHSKMKVLDPLCPNLKLNLLQ